MSLIRNCKVKIELVLSHNVIGKEGAILILVAQNRGDNDICKRIRCATVPKFNMNTPSPYTYNLPYYRLIYNFIIIYLLLIIPL